MLDAVAIHSALAGVWPEVLNRLGIGKEFLVNRHGPCPACGGKDRFRFDNRHGRGDFYCNQCGAGDGFTLLQLVHDWTFSDARRRVIEAAGLGHTEQPAPIFRVAGPQPLSDRPATPTKRVRTLFRESTTPDLVIDVIKYLQSRCLWPLPVDCVLRAHASAEYWTRNESHKSVCIGHYPALLGEVRDVEGELVTVHATWLKDGTKLTEYEPRKLLSKLTGRRGCSVRLMPLASETLGIAEGIESALAAHILHNLPVWATLNASLLAKFEPPRELHRVIVFADNDVPGLRAALKLTEQLDGRTTVVTKAPPKEGQDWADVLAARIRK